MALQPRAARAAFTGRFGVAVTQSTQNQLALAGARILFLSWRDPRHPEAGGSEKYLIEVASRLANRGATVTLFASRPRGTERQSMLDGVSVMRRGGFLSVYVHAAFLLLRSRNQFDAIVDVQNGIPFFSPLFTFGRKPVVSLIHHVHQDQFKQYFGWPMHYVGRALEGPIARWVYGRRPIAVVSPSTRNDVRRRLRLRGPLYVVPNGGSVAGADIRARAREPHITVASRLTAHKRIDLVLAAAAALRPAWPSLHIDICGTGSESAALELQAHELGLERMVTFHGWVGEQQKLALMARAWLTVASSEQEGWGLSVLEANALGVPAVGRNVAGLKDSIRDGVTGWLLNTSDLSKGIDGALRALRSTATAHDLAIRCKAWAASFSWDRTTDLLAGIILAEMRGNGRPHTSDERRASADVSVILESQDAYDHEQETTHALSKRTRATDQWSQIPDAKVRLHLHGCDEHDAKHVLRRLSLFGECAARTASSKDLLLGAVDPDPYSLDGTLIHVA